MEKLDLRKETENTLVDKCLKVYEGSKVSMRLIPNHMEKDEAYNKSPSIANHQSLSRQLKSRIFWY